LINGWRAAPLLAGLSGNTNYAQLSPPQVKDRQPDIRQDKIKLLTKLTQLQTLKTAGPICEN
jgi:hypothetical protein